MESMGFLLLVGAGVSSWLILIGIFKVINIVSEIYGLIKEVAELKKSISENSIKIDTHNRKLADIDRKFSEDVKILEIKHQAQIDTLKEVERRLRNNE